MAHAKHKHDSAHKHHGKHGHDAKHGTKDASVPMTQQRAGLATILAAALAIFGFVAVLVLVVWLLVG